MKNTTKIILGIGASLVGYSIYRANELKNAVAQITAKISTISNVKVVWDMLEISLLADLQLINPTNTAIGLNSAGAIKIKRIAFYNRSNNSLIGEALTDISGIAIEKQSTSIIKDIAVTIPVLTGLLSNIELFGAQKELLAIELTLSIFGKEYKINS